MATYRVVTPNGRAFSINAEDADEAELEIADLRGFNADDCHADLVSTFDDGGEW